MKQFIVLSVLVALCHGFAVPSTDSSLDSYIESLRDVYKKLKEMGREAVCGADMDTLLEKLALPDCLSNMVESARKWVCGAEDESRLVKRGNSDLVLTGYLDTLYEIYGKLKELSFETVCGQTVTDLIELIGLPESLEGIVMKARSWVCTGVLADIFEKLLGLGQDTVCSSTVTELINKLGLPDTVYDLVDQARTFICKI